MADKSITVASFKFGEDTRRSEIVSQPGTLKNCLDAFINQGGEAEVRKALVLYAALDIKDNGGQSDQGVYGIEVTSAGIVCFGSAYKSTDFPAHSVPKLQSAIPAGVTYIQLQHPAVSEGTTYDRTKHLMTSIISTNYNGNSFAAATFSDGNQFFYYNGTIVGESRYGRIITSVLATTALASQLSTQLNEIGWTNNTVSGSSVDIKTPQGVSAVKYLPSDNDSGGSISVTHIGDASDGTPGNSPRAQIKITAITAGSQTLTVTAPDGLGGTVTIASVVVNTATPSVAVQAIVENINATITSPQYSAAYVSSTGTVGLTTPSDTFTVIGPNGNTAINGANLTLSGTGTGTGTGGALSVTASPTSLVTNRLVTGRGNVGVASPSTTAVAAAGTAPYTYAWSRVSGDSTISINNPTAATTSFGATCVVNGDTKTAVFKCVVTDNAAATATTDPSNNVTVSLSATNNL